MKAFRYNSKSREDRDFNNCGVEKNPNALSFYATNLDYAENYKYIYTEDGDVSYECSLEVVELDTTNIFDMCLNYASLKTFTNYINSQIEKQMNDYTDFMNNAKDAKTKKMWANQIAQLENREVELVAILKSSEFQPLSDFERQNELVSELVALGFKGYKTQNEIVIF